ncbi:MAG: M28 family peptidase [Chloroflexi bacterium]|nr:M28 family peptidase [Chloroflexota bacterium]
MRLFPEIFEPVFQRRSAFVLAGLAGLLVSLAVACSTPTATPEPTLVPTPAPTPNVSATEEAIYLAETRVAETLDTAGVEAYVQLEALLAELGPRASATEQESNAAKYLEDKFQQLGYATEIQSFPVIEHKLSGLGLTLTTPEQREFSALPMSESGLGDVSGILTPVGLAMPDDIPEDGLEGRIALAKRGVIKFQAKAENVFAAGAVGLVVYNNASGVFQGALAEESKFPVISISGDDGKAIIELLAASETQASITLTLEERPSQNVIAEKPTKGTSEAVVVLGGHYDSIPDVSGANDNASGIAVLLTIAEMLADADLSFTLRIVPFGSEELGLLGSQAYVESLTDQELENTNAMLNFDALGTGSGVTVFGTSELTEIIKSVGAESGVDIALTRGLGRGTSDFVSFQKEDIHYLMFFGDDTTRIHSELDTIEFVQPEMLGGVVVSTVALLQSGEFAKFVNGN